MTTKLDLVRALEIEKGPTYRAHDFALPQPWVDQVHQETGIYPAPHFIWLYETNSFMGRPYPITATGWVVCRMLDIQP